MEMEQDYIYDIFLSYRRRPPVGDWVKYHFYPLLSKWLNQAMPRDTNGLIYPVVFSDGEHFPPEAKAIQNKDLRKWNISSEVFRETRAYVNFEQEIQLIAQEIWQLLQTVPDYQQDWPVVTPDDFSDAAPTTLIKLPRLQ
jgi:hypothetical protein